MQSAGCIFCKIIAGQAAGEIIYRDDLVTAFQDIHPVAPVHILIVPNEHISSVNEVRPEDEPALGRLFSAARKIAEQRGVEQDGYRLIVNTGLHAGQVVFHLHLHLIGGHPMRFRMG